MPGEGADDEARRPRPALGCPGHTFAWVWQGMRIGPSAVSAWCGRTPCACGESTDACGRAIGFAVLALQVAVYEGR